MTISEHIGRLLAIAFMLAVMFGAVYGGFCAITGADPLGLGWNRPVPADDCDKAGASARFHPGC